MLKNLVINKERFNTEPLQAGGYYMKYMKYKNKYLQLKNNKVINYY